MRLSLQLGRAPQAAALRRPRASPSCGQCVAARPMYRVRAAAEVTEAHEESLQEEEALDSQDEEAAASAKVWHWLAHRCFAHRPLGAVAMAGHGRARETGASCEERYRGRTLQWRSSNVVEQQAVWARRTG